MGDFTFKEWGGIVFENNVRLEAAVLDINVPGVASGTTAVLT
jgi:hypothetical protein